MKAAPAAPATATHMRGGTGGEAVSVTGNEYSVAPIVMATAEPDPMERLQRIVTSTAHVKNAGPVQHC